jgi:DNA-binding XRE family transcriptional regulator
MLDLQPFTTPVAPATLLVAMEFKWHIGDVITKLRKRARMNQTVLGKKVGVNKATIVRAEHGDPKVSRDTYLKIATVLHTNIATLEAEAARLQAEHTDTRRQSGLTQSGAPGAEPAGSSGKHDGRALAPSFGVAPHGQADPVPDASRTEPRRTVTEFDRLARPFEQARVDTPARAARAVGEHAATPRPPKARRRAPVRKRGR